MVHAPPVGPVQALIVVDVQRGLVAGPEAVPDAGGLVRRISAAAARARRAGALVVHLQNDGPPGAVDEPGGPGWELFLPEPGDAIVRKTEDDGFRGTPLGELLFTRGVWRLMITGVLSEMCVSATARGALDRGIGVVLPHDTHGTHPLGEISSEAVARVAEHALGDQVELVAAAEEVAFTGVRADGSPIRA
ncbi:isochorismatase family protein [Streptomyces radicis]|uniref:Isochorismatase family protein n=1 Tax=Streptomyces radicis TaxID=1750517 RepID=A0A3A9WBE3_9ACTN|nr:isochorismatase family protein [Streptomyces radicis]RKN10039.1 isochorismatase family protein [Streptomyces radicis]RKN24380.1 isochorismatase family protein [Streptomyces radicis]